MSPSPRSQPIPAAVRERAAAWHVRLASADAEEADWLNFETWLAESPLHQRAYAAVEQAWVEFDEAPSAARTNIAGFKGQANRRTVVWGGAIAAGLAAVTVATATFQDRPSAQVFETAPGERRVIALADGTQITLNGGSRLTATLGRRERRVKMADAEAVFDVAKDTKRPFVVDAGEREVRVVGTQFNVLHHRGAVTVTVARGVVEVRPAGAAAASPIATLTRGKALMHTPGGRADVVAQADPATAFAWTAGRLVFQGEPLSDVAATLSRYGARDIEVSPDAANLRVTATLSIATQDAMLGTLAEFLPVQAEAQPGKVRLSLRR